MVNTLSSIIKNDVSNMIFTSGYAVSGTTAGWSGSVGFGTYINPKNNLVHIASKLALLNPITVPAAVLIMTANIEEGGVYFDGSVGFGQTYGNQKYAGSLSITEGIYTSREAAHGPYLEAGASGGGNVNGVPVSVGGDAVLSIKGKPVGFAASVGLGGGSSLETHERFGATAFVPLFKKKEDSPNE
jgi:hypothetical protein